MRIVSAASAFPRNYYSQRALIDAFRQEWSGKLEQPRMLEWLHRRVGVEGRYLPYPVKTYIGLNGSGFKIVLSPGVPDMVRLHLAQDVDAFLTDHGLARADIGGWIIHTGGPKVLDATQESLELPPGALDASWECLRKTGNLSSAAVLGVLEKFMMERRPSPGTWSVLAAMGPGFCSELALLRW
jgi:predicted naringenin-chalcone synthase